MRIRASALNKYISMVLLLLRLLQLDWFGKSNFLFTLCLLLIFFLSFFYFSARIMKINGASFVSVGTLQNLAKVRPVDYYGSFGPKNLGMYETCSRGCKFCRGKSVCFRRSCYYWNARIWKFLRGSQVFVEVYFFTKPKFWVTWELWMPL